MLKISPFTPLFFNPTTDRFGAKSKYIQKFASSDIIFIELIGDKSDAVPALVVRDLINERQDSIEWHTWNMNNNQIIYFHIITGLNSGYYDVLIGDSWSEIFKVTNDSAELNETTVIQYSMKDNRQRTDCIFWIDGMQYFFDFRAPGGFKDNNWSFTVDNEQFTTADGDIVELYSREATQKIFTLGNSIGCPVWFADFLNRILCCNYIYFDGVRYARKDGGVPELNQEIEGLKSFVFNQQLQQIKSLDPVLEWNNQVAMRRVQGDNYRKTDTGDMRSIKFGTEKPVAEIGTYINMSNATPNTGTSINSDTMITVNSIHHPGGDEQSYWDLITIKTTDIDSKYIGRKGYGKLVITGLDSLKSSLDDSLINLRAILYTGGPYSNLIEGSVVSRDGVYILKGVDAGDVGTGKEFQLYLDYVYDYDIDNIGMTIELTWVYDND